MSWKDLSELTPQLSSGEIRFEKAKRVIGLVLGPVCFVIALLSPTLPHVSPLGMRTLAVFSWGLVWWVTEPVPIPVTSLLVLALFVVCGVTSYEKAFGYWSHWAVLFLFGACIIGHAMHIHGLTRRFSLKLVSSRLVGGSPWRLLVFFLLANTLLTAVMSNTVSAVLFLSIGLGLLEIMKLPPGSSYGLAMFLGVAWATNTGAVLTPSGTPVNLIAITLLEPLGVKIGYAQWFMATFPFAVLQTIATIIVLRIFLRKDDIAHPIPQDKIREELKELGPFNRGEIFSAMALAVALLLWVAPDLFALALGRQHPLTLLFSNRLNWAVVAVLVATSLFILPVDWKARKFVMTWTEAVKGVEWGTMALVAGALAAGDLFGDKKLGLGEFFAQGISSIAGPHTSRYMFLLIAITVAVILTQLANNVAVISLMGAIAIAVAPSVDLNPIALTITMSTASCIAYSLPMASVGCSIVFASGYVRILPMFLRGTLLSVVGIILLSFFGYTIANWVLPWPPPIP